MRGLDPSEVVQTAAFERKTLTHPQLFKHPTEGSCSRNFFGSLVEFLHLDELDETVEFLLGILIFVSFPRDSDPDLARHVPNAIHPDVSVQLGVNADILRGIRQNAKWSQTDNTFQID